MVREILPSLCTSYAAFGFEASRDSFEMAQEALADRGDIDLINVALCYDVPESGKLRLYRDHRSGLGNSLLREQFGAFEEVQAARFSNWVEKQDFELKDHVCLLRMNIEGSEFDVVRDLVESGLSDLIDGYFGMWDDLAKIDPALDEEFREFLKCNTIHTSTFNGRDFRSKLRLRCIRYNVGTALLAGVKRLQDQKNKVREHADPRPA